MRWEGGFKKKSWPNVPKGLLAFMQQSTLELSGGVGQNTSTEKSGCQRQQNLKPRG